MLRRSAGPLLVAALLAGGAGCTTPVSETASLVLAQELGGGSIRQQTLAELAGLALARAQREGAIPDSVEVHQPPDTLVVRVVARAGDRSDAARVANDAADELATRLDFAAHRLGGERFVVVEYAPE